MSVEDLWRQYHDLNRTLRAAHGGWCRPGGMTDREIRVMNRAMRQLGNVKLQLFQAGEDPYIRPRQEPLLIDTD